jgi:hypothetical protein
MGVESSGPGDGASISDLGDSAPQGERESGRGKVTGGRDGGWKREERAVKETPKERLN